MVLCATIRRVVGPLQVVVDASLREADVAKQLALAGVVTSKPASLWPHWPERQLCHCGTTSTLPSDSQADWEDADLQHHGRQAPDELDSIMESRPEKGFARVRARPSFPKWRQPKQQVLLSPKEARACAANRSA